MNLFVKQIMVSYTHISKSKQNHGAREAALDLNKKLGDGDGLLINMVNAT